MGFAVKVVREAVADVFVGVVVDGNVTDVGGVDEVVSMFVRLPLGSGKNLVGVWGLLRAANLCMDGVAAIL